MPVGRQKIISYFKNAKNNECLSAVYILEGDRGTGKKTLAKYLSLLIMCDESEPCLECAKCRYTLSGTNTDIYTVSNEDKASIGIDKVRDIIREAYVMPGVSNKKIFIINNAHLLTKEAQNALLKVIEEPPEYVMFFLLCENTGFLLQTVLSRAVTVKLTPLSNDEMTQITGCTDSFLIEYASGSPGRLLELMEDESFKALRNGFFNIIKNLISNDAYSIYKIYDFFDENKEKKDALMEMIITFFRDVLFYKNHCEKYVINKDKIALITEFSDALATGTCQKICGIVIQAKNELGKYGGFAVNIHSMLIKIWEEIYG